MAAETYRAVSGGWRSLKTGTTIPIDPPTPTPDIPAMHRIGISSSRQGLNSGETHKRQATMDRYAEMATQLGITAAQMRALGGRHVYDTNQAPVSNAMSIGVFNNCVSDGYGTIMLTSSRWNDTAGAAAGNHDNTIRACLDSLSNSGAKVVWNVKHEPSNNGMSATEEGHWRQIQARVAWLVHEHGDPNVHYTDCHIPMAADQQAWNWMPELQALRPGDWQAINDRTYLGLDPYPEVGIDGGEPDGHKIQTILQKCGGAITAQRGWGRTGPICLPEVAFFNWCVGHSETYTLTAAEQAQRMHDELWTWGQANQLLSYFYYDVTDLNDADVRDSSRTIDSPDELLEYARLMRGDYYTGGA